MSANFEAISNGISSIPGGSATDEFLSWVENKELNIPLIKRTGVMGFEVNQQETSRAALCSAARGLMAFIALPAIAQIGAVYNLVAGLTKVGFGIVCHFKQVEKDQVKAHISAGLQHLMVAVYDFAVSYLAMAIGIAYAILPRSADLPISVEGFHDWLYKGQMIPAEAHSSDTPAPAPALGPTEPSNRSPSQIQSWANWTVEGLFAPANQSAC